MVGYPCFINEEWLRRVHFLKENSVLWKLIDFIDMVSIPGLAFFRISLKINLNVFIFQNQMIF